MRAGPCSSALTLRSRGRRPRSAAVVTAASLTHSDIGAGLAIVGLIGPRAARLLAAAQLTGDLPTGAVATAAGERSIVAILRERRRRYLALVRADAADAFWARLLTAGEPLGVAFVGFDALTLLDVSACDPG